MAISSVSFLFCILSLFITLTTFPLRPICTITNCFINVTVLYYNKVIGIIFSCAAYLPLACQPTATTKGKKDDKFRRQISISHNRLHADFQSEIIFLLSKKLNDYKVRLILIVWLIYFKLLQPTVVIEDFLPFFLIDFRIKI